MTSRQPRRSRTLLTVVNAADDGDAQAERERLRLGWVRSIRFHLRQQRQREGKPPLELLEPGQ